MSAAPPAAPPAQRRQSARSMEVAQFQSNLMIQAPPFKYNEKRKWTDPFFTVFLVVSLIAMAGISFKMISDHTPLSETFDVALQCAAGNRRLDLTDPRTLYLVEHGDDGRRLTKGDYAAVAVHNEMRRLSAKVDGESTLFTLFGEVPEVASTCIALIVFIAVGWLVALQKFAREIVYGTFVVKMAMWVYLGTLVKKGGGAGEVYYVVAGLILIWVLRNPQKLHLASTMISRASTGLQRNPGLFLACTLLYGPFLGYVALMIIALSSVPGLFEVDFTTCQIFMPDYVLPMTRYLTLHFLFMQHFMEQARLLTVGGTISTWWFTNTPDKPSNLATYWLKAAVTTSSGTLSITAIIGAVCDWIRLKCNGRWWWTNPIGIICKILYCMFQTIIISYTRLNTVVHCFTNESFCASGKRTYGILKRNFVNAIATEWVSESVISLGVFAFSAAITAVAWAWYEDTLPGANILTGGGDPNLFIYFFLLMFFVANPAFTVLIISMFFSGTKMESFCTSEPTCDAGYTIILLLSAIFIGCVSNLIFTYMGAIIRDATTAMLMCFAVDRDNGTSSHEDQSVKEALSGLPCVYAPEQNIQLVVQQPSVQAVPVTQGVPVAMPVASPTEAL